MQTETYLLKSHISSRKYSVRRLDQLAATVVGYIKRKQAGKDIGMVVSLKNNAQVLTPEEINKIKEKVKSERKEFAPIERVSNWRLDKSRHEGREDTISYLDKSLSIGFYKASGTICFKVDDRYVVDGVFSYAIIGDDVYLLRDTSLHRLPISALFKEDFDLKKEVPLKVIDRYSDFWIEDKSKAIWYTTGKNFMRNDKVVVAAPSDPEAWFIEAEIWGDYFVVRYSSEINFYHRAKRTIATLRLKPSEQIDTNYIEISAIFKLNSHVLGVLFQAAVWRDFSFVVFSEDMISGLHPFALTEDDRSHQPLLREVVSHNGALHAWYESQF